MIEYFTGDVRAKSIDNGAGLQLRYFEAGPSDGSRPLILLLHGFPELAFSWRKIVGPLADRGYHVVAPDQRGYGETTGADLGYDGDVQSYSMLNLTRDIVGLVQALGYSKVHAVIGHDFGSSVAGFCALIRPDMFKSVTFMSAPFTGAPPLHAPAPGDIDVELNKLSRPRKHYQRYYSTRPANDDMIDCSQGLTNFLRAYYHHKSADWTDNRPHELSGWTADQLEKMPTYYIMDADRDMAETVAPHMPTPEQIKNCEWLSDAELAVYADAFLRTSLQGGLNWYRCRFIETIEAQLQTFSGAVINQPAMFVAGTSDWGTWQIPGALETMQSMACSDWRGTHLVQGAGHWVQQEQPDQVLNLLINFVDDAAP